MRCAVSAQETAHIFSINIRYHASSETKNRDDFSKVIPVSAVRTGLEPATSGVTGRHSNQAELPHRFSCLPFLSERDCKDIAFLIISKFFRKKFIEKMKNEHSRTSSHV